MRPGQRYIGQGPFCPHLLSVGMRVGCPKPQMEIHPPRISTFLYRGPSCYHLFFPGTDRELQPLPPPPPPRRPPRPGMFIGLQWGGDPFLSVGLWLLFTSFVTLGKCKAGSA